MGFWDRLKRLFSTNINAALDAVEDKEAALEQIVKDMSAEHRKTKGYLAEAIVHLKKLERDAEKHKETAEAYLKKAKAILADADESNDYLAREALARKKEEEAVAAQYTAAAENQKKAVETLKANIDAMEKKISDATRKKQVLLAKKQMAETQTKIASMAGQQPDNQAFEAFKKIEQDIDDMAVEAEVKMELTVDNGKSDVDVKLEAIGFQSDVEDEFLALKNEVAGLLPEKTGPKA